MPSVSTKQKLKSSKAVIKRIPFFEETWRVDRAAMHMSSSKPIRHIGIVACSAEGAALCYRTICAEAPALLGGEPNAHPEISLHTICLAEYMKFVKIYDWSAVADLMLTSANKLSSIGAQFLICPDNTIHHAFPFLLSRSPLPWLHICEEVAKVAKSRGFKKLAITGTKYTMESATLYCEKLLVLGIESVSPQTEERTRINDIIFKELVNGLITDASREYFRAVIRRMKDQEGCDAVVLGCTEIPLLIDDENSPLPTLDSTRILARAAIRKSVQE